MSTRIVPRLARLRCTRHFTSSPSSSSLTHQQSSISNLNKQHPQRRSYATSLFPEPVSNTRLPAQRKKRIIVAMTGATGAVLGIKILQALRALDVETHLVMSKWAEATVKHETEHTPQQIRGLASFSYSMREQSAAMSSGSFQHDGMVVVPCSMKTLAGIRAGYCEDLVTRAADVVLKEHRKLVLVVRETPLSVIHLDNMLALARLGVVVFPPVPAWYTRPATLADVEDQTVGRILDMFHLDTGGFERWSGFGKEKKMQREVPTSVGEVVG